MARGDLYATPFGAVYSTYMEHPGIGRRVARLVWGGDTGPYYESMAAVGELEEGSTVVDCPCGAGPALRALRPDAGIRYVAVDRSRAMLRRAGKRALERGLVGIELLEADATDLPLPEAGVDLFFSFWGLHCFDDPAGALAEAGRVLKPGGRLVGACFLRGEEALRQRLLIRPHRGDFGAVPSQPEVEEMLAAAGFPPPSLSRSGPMLYFDAVRAAPAEEDAS